MYNTYQGNEGSAVKDNEVAASRTGSNKTNRKPREEKVPKKPTDKEEPEGHVSFPNLHI